MHSDLIGKIQKARRYAQEPERIAIDELEVRFNGGNNVHFITLSNDHWSCSCSFFRMWQTCAHIMGVQKLLGVMLSAEARSVPDITPVDQEQTAANTVS